MAAQSNSTTNDVTVMEKLLSSTELSRAGMTVSVDDFLSGHVLRQAMLSFEVAVDPFVKHHLKKAFPERCCVFTASALPTHLQNTIRT
eukprot:m.1001810 g.1001810  ORF g.1001810 m.1001810 type:complete len:88 (+) comp24033_c0_seq13:414-677(+)